MKPALFFLAVLLLIGMFAAEAWIHLTLFLIALLPPSFILWGILRFKEWRPIRGVRANPVEMPENQREEYLSKPLSGLDSAVFHLRFPATLQFKMGTRNVPILLATALIPATIVVFYLQHSELLLRPLEPGGSALYLKLLVLCYLVAFFFIALAYRWLWERVLLSYGIVTLAAVQSVAHARAGRQVRYEFRDPSGGFWRGISNYFDRGPDPKVLVVFCNPRNPDWSCPTGSFVFHRFTLLSGAQTVETCNRESR